MTPQPKRLLLKSLAMTSTHKARRLSRVADFTPDCTRGWRSLATPDPFNRPGKRP